MLFRSSLLVIINDYIAIREYYAPRWLAVRLLEGDVDVAARLSGLPGGSELLPAAGKRRAELAVALGEDIDLFIADRRYTWIHNLAGRVVRAGSAHTMSNSDRIDHVMTDRRLGIPIFMLAMWLVFKITTDLSAPWVDWIDGVLSGPISRWVMTVLGAIGLGETWVASLLIDGVIAGVGGVLVFVPVLMALYFALAVLEDSGYMARGRSSWIA